MTTYNFTNFTAANTLPEAIYAMNAVSNDWFGSAFLLSLYFVVLIVSARQGEDLRNAFLVAGATGLTLCGILLFFGMVGGVMLSLFIVAFVAGILMVAFR